MKFPILFKSGRLVLLILMLTALIPLSVSADGPDDGEVGIALSLHGGFSLNPASDWFADEAQFVPAGGYAVTEFVVTDVEDLFSVNVAFDYDSSVAQVHKIEAGTLFDHLSSGIDYIITTNLNQGFPLDPDKELPIPAPPLYTPDRRSYVNIAVINHYHPYVPLRGNGSLIRITWKVSDVPGETPIDFTIANLADEAGNFLEPCYPITICINSPTDPLPDPFLPGHTVGKLVVTGAPGGVDFQVGLEGGKLPTADGGLIPPRPAIDIKAFIGSAEIPGTVLDDFGRANIPELPPFDKVFITRPGYLKAAANPAHNFQPHLVILLAGDLDDNQAIDIFDITRIANQLNRPADNAYRETMDYNSDGIITIVDLALVAKNYGIYGPTPIESPYGPCQGYHCPPTPPPHYPTPTPHYPTPTPHYPTPTPHYPTPTPHYPTPTPCHGYGCSHH